MFLKAPDHPARSDEPGPARGVLAWALPLPGQRTVNLQPVVGDDGTVYVGTWGDGSTGDHFNGQLYAVRPDGTVLWSFDPGEAEQPSQEQHPVWGTIEGVPVLDPERGRLYFGRGDNKLWSVALSDGALLWSFPTFPTQPERLPELGGQVISPPTPGPGGSLHFGTVPYTGLGRTTVFAVDPEGVEVWRHEFEGSDGVWGSPAVADDGTVYVSRWDDGGHVTALRPDGAGGAEVLWDVAMPGTRDVLLFHPTLDAERGALYVPGGRTTGVCEAQPVIASLDAADGSLRWAWRSAGAAEDIAYHVALDADGDLVFGTASTQQLWPWCATVPDEGRLYRAADLGTELSVLWSRPTPGAVMGVAIDSDGIVYASLRGDWRLEVPGRVIAVDREGLPAWSAPVAVEGEIWWSPPALGPDGRLYVGTNPCADVLNLLPCPGTPALVAVD